MEALYRVLYVLPRLDPLDVWRWQGNPNAWSDRTDPPDHARGRLFRVRGKVVDLQEIDLPTESARRFHYAKMYRVTLQPSTDPRPRIVYARELPQQWQKRPPASGTTAWWQRSRSSPSSPGNVRRLLPEPHPPLSRLPGEGLDSPQVVGRVPGGMLKLRRRGDHLAFHDNGISQA